MYATINIPGSSHFEYHGPASRSECQAWLKTRTAILSQTEQITSLMPQRIVADKEALAWKYRDGSQVIRPRLSDAEMEATFGKPALPCGCPGEPHPRTGKYHYTSCPGYGLK